MPSISFPRSCAFSFGAQPALHARPVGAARPGARSALATAVLLGAALCAAGAAHAQSAADPAADLGPLTQRWLDDALTRNQPAGLPLRMEVSVGSLDSRLRLAPCARVEPYLPVGSRLWGRTRLGLRCVEGQTAWNVYLPVTVKAFGPAWVLTSAVAPGTVLTAADATEAEVDWAAETAPVMANPEMWVGQIAARQLVPGQALRQSMVRAPSLFRAGAQVKVVAQGPGYAVTSAGQAMSAGAAGQIVRIRMDNGRIISGTVNENGTIDVTL
ncbi:flagellar basal body P-ring formation chaperone FlgA [Acidovorax sp. sic0104]|uniref:flagellar basal body P-ring formation chaperone FlgA n=1 Tax=Acidovorax sp. sic0104 TaxID=2854784 RepID=UPI001C477329|nr:flagellar basal body P-ring formation chaperone FlgA [Acidovorax sp. sic0104]MBV7544169.1 flagellar basal body P-ring formation protein FlgA [Acidovorax sp. sic0104]